MIQNQQEYNNYFLEWSKVVNNNQKVIAKKLEQLEIITDLLDSRLQRIIEYIKEK